jgi:chlorite dismutase
MDPERQNPRTHIIPGGGKYLFIDPFVKTRDGYQLSFPTHQGMMDEHIQAGSKDPSVKLNTTYSFGIMTGNCAIRNGRVQGLPQPRTQGNGSQPI